MNGTRSRFGAALVAIIALALAATAAGAAGSTRDRTWCDPALGGRPLSTIAILPVVSLTGSDRAESWVEHGWALFYAQAKTTWVPADQVRDWIPEARLAAIRAQVWREGSPSAGSARDIAGALGVDAVLSVRVDRWEVADGGRAMVEMTAVLLAADGTRLWSISGLAGHGIPPGSRERNFNTDMTCIWDPRLEPRTSPDPLALAMCTLFARWSVALPGAIAPETGAPPALLAGAAR